MQANANATHQRSSADANNTNERSSEDAHEQGDGQRASKNCDGFVWKLWEAQLHVFYDVDMEFD